MDRTYRIAVLSDIHYAGPMERARGNDYEFRDLTNPLSRLFVRSYRRFIWLRYPLRQNHLLDEFMRRVGEPDQVIANGDYSCDTGFVGMSDDAALESARECLGKIRTRFGSKFQATFGDHEFGKLSFFGGKGGMRLASWDRSRRELALKPIWQVDVGDYALIGMTSTLAALPIFQQDMLEDERAGWGKLGAEHYKELRRVFAELNTRQRVILFCHDPSALPFLAQDEVIKSKLTQIEQTIIGHLHSPLVFWKSQLLAGMPPIRFLGHTTKRLSTSLAAGKLWRPFNVRLCPSLAGIELLKDGGYYTIEIDPEARHPARFEHHRLSR